MNLSLISKKFKQFPILFVCGLLIPLSVILFFMRGPKISDYEAELTRLEGEWNRIQQNRERSVGLEDDIEVLDEGLSSIQGRLMNVDEVASNYEFFYGLERQTGVSLVQFAQGAAFDGEDLPLTLENLKHFTVIPYDVVMTGTLQELLSFMDLLDRQEFIVRYDMVNVFKPNDEPLESETLLARLKCHVLALKNE